MLRIRTLTIVCVLVSFAILPLSIIIYGALAGAIGGLAIVLVIAAVQYPLLRYCTRNIEVEESEPSAGDDPSSGGARAALTSQLPRRKSPKTPR